jgi:hypothetical protein
LNRFSNADKHRLIMGYMPFPGRGSGQLSCDSTVLEQWSPSSMDHWEADKEFELGRYRFAKPYPSKMSFNANVSVEVLFGTPAFGKHALGHALNIGALQEVCEHVAMVVDLFKKL